MMCQIYDELADQGYTGDTAISDYILDQLNTKNETSYVSLIDMIWIIGNGFLPEMVHIIMVFGR